MTIQARLADGRVLQFPDGTDPAIIQRTVKAQISAKPAEPEQPEQRPPFIPGQTPQLDLPAVADVAAVIGSGVVAEPVAGLAGIGASVIGGADAGAEAVRATREALTVQPRTEGGEKLLQSAGEVLAPVGEAIAASEETLGDFGNRMFGPIGGAIGKTIPTAVLTALGIRKKAGGAPDITPQRAREIEEVLAASKAQGIDVLTSDIFRPKSIFSRLSQQFVERIPVVGTGGKRAAQQEQRVAALDRLDESIPRVEASDIVENLKTSANKTRVAAGKRIDDSIVEMGKFGTVPTDNAVSAIDRAIGKLGRPGKIPNKAVVDELNNLKQTLGEADQDFRSLREFRTDARAIAEKTDSLGRSQLRSSDKALMDSVISGITKDLDGFVLSNTNPRGLDRYKAADRIYASEAQKLTKSRLKTILDKGDVNPELVNNLLFSSSPSQVRLLFDNLDASGRQNARMSLYRRALDNSTKKGEISPQRFVSELDKLNRNFKTFFRGENRAEMEGLKRLLQTTARAGDTGVTTPTGQALQLPAVAALSGAAATGTPAAIATLLGASTVGLAGRALESNSVRRMLIRLGKAPKRSTLEADLQRTIPLLLEKSNQVLEQEQSVETAP